MNDETRQPGPLGGNKNPFNELYKGHRLFLYRELRKYLGESEAEDATQEVWIRVNESLKDLREPDKFRSWLVSIARNYARSHYRKNGQLLESLNELENSDREPKMDSWPHFIHEADLERILRPLNDEQREWVKMRVFQGLGLKEIARKKGVPLGTLKSQSSRLKAKLREILSKYINSK